MSKVQRFAIYTRVSTTEQTTENQVIRLVDYCKLNGFEYKVFQETESSRKTRPIKMAVLDLLRKHQFDGVIVWKLDRWARSLKELVLNLEEFKNNGYIFISLTDRIDLSTSTGTLQFHILSAFAEFERNLIRERTMEWLHRAKLNGKTLGRPFGAKDKKVRRMSGYILRNAKVKQKTAEANGDYKPVEFFIDNQEYQSKTELKQEEKQI
jgi:DNA invertase Pin-like site-specific DNA recombinase